MSEISVGKLTVPGDWPKKTSATIAMPVEKLNLKLPGKKAATTAMQPNLVVTRGPTKIDGNEENLKAITEAIATTIPNSTISDAESFAFADGSAGLMCAIDFAVGQMSISQSHIIKYESQELVHIVATVPRGRTHDAEKLLNVAKTYTN